MGGTLAGRRAAGRAGLCAVSGGRRRSGESGASPGSRVAPRWPDPRHQSDPPLLFSQFLIVLRASLDPLKSPAGPDPAHPREAGARGSPTGDPTRPARGASAKGLTLVRRPDW